MTNIQVEQPDHRSALKLISQLENILLDAVEGGASIGFLPPLAEESAKSYWQGVFAAMQTRYRILLIARDGDQLVGTVQLDLASRANATHRAEVCKLMVLTSHRRHGIAQQLMHAIEEQARAHGISTLVLDTRQGDPSEDLYAKLGYIRGGLIPEYARSADGVLHTTVLMYKLLK